MIARDGNRVNPKGITGHATPLVVTKLTFLDRSLQQHGHANPAHRRPENHKDFEE